MGGPRDEPMTNIPTMREQAAFDQGYGRGYESGYAKGFQEGRDHA